MSGVCRKHGEYVQPGSVCRWCEPITEKAEGGLRPQSLVAKPCRFMTSITPRAYCGAPATWQWRPVSAGARAVDGAEGPFQFCERCQVLSMNGFMAAHWNWTPISQPGTAPSGAHKQSSGTRP